MGMNGCQIEVIRSARKTLALQVTRDMRVVVRAPFWVSGKEIERFVSEKSAWISEKLAQMSLCAEKTKDAPKFTKGEIADMTKKAREVITERLSFFAVRMGVKYGKVTVRHQTSRYGSCSSKGNLSFNCVLVLCPDWILDYVVVHELCHLKQMNHSAAFWAEVGALMPNYREAREWLKQNGGVLIQRLK
jgi:predicted metal-dependent hydrolase